MQTAYHITARRNLGAIYRWGLIPRDTAAHNFPQDAPHNHGITAVYVFENFSNAWTWKTWLRWLEPLVILELDVGDLPADEDPYLISAHRVLCRIPPDRIVTHIAA